MIKLVVLDVAGEYLPEVETLEYNLAQSRSYPLFLVGRDDSNDVVINHPTVSRSHMVIKVSGDSMAVRDIGSKNGTWINSKRLELYRWSPLDDGDQVRLGAVLLLVVTNALILENGGRLDLAAFENARAVRSRSGTIQLTQRGPQPRPLPSKFTEIEESILAQERFARAQRVLLHGPDEHAVSGRTAAFNPAALKHAPRPDSADRGQTEALNPDRLPPELQD